jgi:hypothetical protein
MESQQVQDGEVVVSSTEAAVASQAAHEIENEKGFTAEEQELYNQAKEPHERYNVLMLRDGRKRREALEARKREWSGSEAGKLFRQLGETFQALRAFLTENPEMEHQAEEFDEVNQRIFNRMRTNIERANSAPRCQHQKFNGQQCRAPKMRGKKYCRMHVALEEARPQKMDLPNLGDANGIQAAIAKGAQAVVDGTLDRQQAGMLGYYLQLALSNVGRVDFEEGWEGEEETG